MSDCNTEHVEPNATQDVQSVGRVKRVDVPSGYYLQDDDKQGWAFHETQNDRVPLDSSLDYISRQAAIDAVHKSIFDFFDICDDDEESPMTYQDKRLLELNKAITTRIKAFPSAQPEYEPVTAEDFAKTMSRITPYSVLDWNGMAFTLMKEMGFVICKKTM